MNYHNITKEDMLNGEGLRVVLWVSGCSHNCNGCQNPQTHDPNGGILFDEDAKEEIFAELRKPHIDGITLSGGDPLNEHNVKTILKLVEEIRKKFPDKTIWIYSGYTMDDLYSDNTDMGYYRRSIINMCDVFIDGKFVLELKDDSLHWRGSSNQNIIKIRK